MSRLPASGRGALLLAVLLAPAVGLGAQTDDGIIRLRPSSAAPPPADKALERPRSEPEVGGTRRGFDYDSFEARLESLWFQRKTLLADGRHSDAAEQSRLIHAFCAEEGVRRLENLSGALVAEARGFIEQGHHARAIDSLALAESFDPGRPQVHLARAVVFWKSDRGYLAAAGELFAALRFSLIRSVKDLSLFNLMALILVAASIGCVLVYSLLMLARYQVPFRHEVEEWVSHAFSDRWARATGWALLFLPLVLWFGAGWIALYWILITFRFMRSGEKIAAVFLLLASALLIPAYRLAVTTYGMTADPAVRTTLASAGGEYGPDRILKLRQLVHAHPEDPIYHFLLAGLFKNGRYFEDAFAEYKEALELDPALEQAHVNIGNIFFTTGQYAEAIASYNNALAINPRSILSYFNRHLAQSESFRFSEAQESLREARLIDSEKLARLFAAAGSEDERPTVIDATLGMDSVWSAALAGRGDDAEGENLAQHAMAWLPRQLSSPISIVALAVLAACGLAAASTRGRAPARRCIRCGRPFCHYCKTAREGHEYCSQCLHLYVLGDGLAPETKTRKMYEVARHERISRSARRLVSLLMPGAAQILRGRAMRGSLLVLVWLAALIAWQPIGLLPIQRFLGLDLRLDLLGQRSVPAIYDVNAFGLIALLTAIMVWLAGNAWRWRRREP